jgi:hypothetical protein
MKHLLTLALCLIALPAWGQDALDTPEFRQRLRGLNNSSHWADKSWAADIMRLSAANGPEVSESTPWFWRWDYFAAVMLEDDDEATSEAKYQEAIATADAWMRAAPVGYYAHGPQFYAICYGRLVHKLTAQTEAAWRAAHDARVRHLMGWGAWGPRIRLGDSDATLGAFSLVTTTDLTFGSDYCSLQSANAVDGTDWVACSVAEMYAQILKWRKTATGGEWIAGTGYNTGEVREIALTSGMLGPDKYPELRSWLKESAVQHQWHLTPGLKPDGYTFWGDNQADRSLYPHFRGPLLHCLASLADEPGNLLHVAQAIYPKLDAFAGDCSILMLDPKRLPETPSVTFPTGLRTTGVGLVTYRTADTVAFVFCPVPVSGTIDGFTDHQMVQWNVGLWRDGAWRIDSASAYMPWSRNHNGSECYGFDPPYDKRIIATREIDGGFEVEMEAKDLENPPGYEPAPPFIRQMYRKIRYQHGQTEYTDRVDAVDPKTLKWFDHRAYADYYYGRRIAPLAQFHHSPTEPQATADGFTWKDAAGDEVRLVTTAPIRSVVKAQPDVNLSPLTAASQAQGWIVQLGAEKEIVTLVGLAVEPPPSTDVEVRGVIRGRQLIIELP